MVALIKFWEIFNFKTTMNERLGLAKYIKFELILLEPVERFFEINFLLRGSLKA